MEYIIMVRVARRTVDSFKVYKHIIEYNMLSKFNNYNT